MSHEMALAMLEMEQGKYEAALVILASRCKDEQLSKKISEMAGVMRKIGEKVIMVEDMRVE